MKTSETGIGSLAELMYWKAMSNSHPPDPRSWKPETRHLDREHLDSLHGDLVAIFEVCRGDWDTTESAEHELAA